MTIRTLIVDDSPLTTELIATYLENIPSVELVASAGSAAVSSACTARGSWRMNWAVNDPPTSTLPKGGKGRVAVADGKGAGVAFVGAGAGAGAGGGA